MPKQNLADIINIIIISIITTILILARNASYLFYIACLCVYGIPILIVHTQRGLCLFLEHTPSPNLANLLPLILIPWFTSSVPKKVTGSQ